MTRLLLAIRQEGPSAEEAYGRQTRDEWAASRTAEGWSQRLVREATGAGALSEIRAAIRSEKFSGPPRFHRAVRALAIIESGRGLEMQYPTLEAFRPDHGLQVRAAAPPIRRR